MKHTHYYKQVGYKEPYLKHDLSGKFDINPSDQKHLDNVRVQSAEGTND